MTGGKNGLKRGNGKNICIRTGKDNSKPHLIPSLIFSLSLQTTFLKENSVGETRGRNKV